VSGGRKSTDVFFGRGEEGSQCSRKKTEGWRRRSVRKRKKDNVLYGKTEGRLEFVGEGEKRE